MSDDIFAAIDAGVHGAYTVARLFGKSMEELGREYKPEDGDTQRTIIDRESGRAILNCLKELYPNDHFTEEETGYHAGTGNRRWYVDPFDGTSNAAIKLPLSTVGIALEQDGELVVGVAVDPFNGLVYSAEIGAGAFVQSYIIDNRFDGSQVIYGEPRSIRVSGRSDPKERYAEIDGFFNAETSGRKAGFLRDLAGYAHNVRMTGSNIRSGLNLASGGTDIWLIDAVGGFYDIAPGCVLVTEAGGKVTDIYGNTPAPGVQVAIGTNNVGDHEILRELARKHYEGYAGFR